MNWQQVLYGNAVKESTLCWMLLAEESARSAPGSHGQRAKKLMFFLPQSH
jgi:hypothetical protein